MNNEMKRDDALFEELSKSKKKRRRKILITIGGAILVVAVVLVSVVSHLKKQVRMQFASGSPEVLSYDATVGTLHTVVSGSGTLAYVDEETLTVPAGVEIQDVNVERYDAVAQGDILATVNMATVLQAMSDVQEKIDDLDDQISNAGSEQVSRTITAGVSGRVKWIYAEKGDDVTGCMADNGALALVSLDGYLYTEIEANTLNAGDEVLVTRTNGETINGSVEKVVGTVATIVVSDDGPEYGETVTVSDENQVVLGSGTLQIHSPLKITGYAGTVSSVSASVNQRVYSGTTLFYLTDTDISTNYESLLRSREEQEEILMQLLTIYHDGAVLAPYDGLISSVDYDENTSADAETALVTITPNEEMQVTISVSESDILSLEPGQTAQIGVSSVGDEAYTGTVTEVSKVATTNSGVTVYSAVVEFPMTADVNMLPGMSADVDIRIQGVENAILVPVEAVHQTSAICYVYTTYDEETEEYGGKVEVTTGLWGDKYVEIIDGLSEGDSVFYAEEQSFDFGSFVGMGGMSGMADMGGMTDMGDFAGGFGGEMPGSFDGMGDMGGRRPDGQ